MKYVFLILGLVIGSVFLAYNPQHIDLIKEKTEQVIESGKDFIKEHKDKAKELEKFQDD